MAEKKAFYLTTTIPYVNADPHIGFALEVVQADIVARFKRLMGHAVFFNAGTDEHGQKIWEKAQEKGEDVQTYVDRYAASVRRLKGALDLSYDRFIRTTDPEHKAAAEELWKRCESAGDIYKKKYKGLYCVGCEKFLTERDLENGKCPLHPGQDPIELEEENYFFRLSKYQGKILEYLSRSGVIIPAHRLKEAQQFVAAGLEDFSISREKQRLPWGVAVPGDDTQVMYVWFDALTNYISTLGWPEDTKGLYIKFWEEGETVQMAGKDQIRFQSIMWQAMLMSANLSTTDKVFYHGFITSTGQRMSKSLGNVIDPVAIVEEYGTDALRYYLARHTHPVDDSDFTLERFKEIYNANLANGLGNLVARVMKLSEDNAVQTIFSEFSFSPHLQQAMNTFEFNDAMDFIWQKIQTVDRRITETEPYKVIKTDVIEGKALIQFLVQDVYEIGKMLEPFMPETAKKIQQAVKENKKPETLFPRKD